MNVTFGICFIIVRDQDEALTFYRDVLGLRVHTDVVAFDDVRWLTVTPPSQPDIQIGLVPASMGHSPDDAAALDALVAKGAMSGFIFTTEDVDKAFEHIRAAGAEVLQEPIDQAYGVRDCAFRDPSGNHLRFSQSMAG
jgi:catechol 2,3-dioxygenase-like lactoylglutathione lyase family enzyme